MPRALSWLLFFASLSFASRAANALELPELADRARPSVVLLTVGDSSDDNIGSGTGFFVSKDGRIVTNHHVIEHASKITATLADGRKIEVMGFLADDEKRDIAVLQAPPGEYPALLLGGGAPLRVGDEVVVIGSPMGLSASLSAGLVSAIREHGLIDEAEFGKTLEDGRAASWAIQITAAISPGSSGSPVMNRQGEVVGVAVGHVSGEGLNFSIPVDVPKSMIASIAPGAIPKKFGSTRRVGILGNLAISAAVFGLPYLVFVLAKKRAERREANERAARLRH